MQEIKSASAGAKRTAASMIYLPNFGDFGLIAGIIVTTSVVQGSLASILDEVQWHSQMARFLPMMPGMTDGLALIRVAQSRGTSSP